MKKFLVLLFTFVLTILTVFGCSKEASSAVDSGKVLVINLETNPTTGYDWSYEMTNMDADAANIVFLDAYEEFTNQDKGLVGAPILRHYKFKADKQGKQNIKFTYKRNWEGGDVAYSIVYNLTVGSDMKINLDSVEYEGNSSDITIKHDYSYEN